MSAQPGISRRRLLAAGAALGGVAVTSGGTAAALVTDPATTTEPCWGEHQAGVATALQAFATFVALRLRRDVGRGDLVRLMRLWTDDIERLTTGRPALADVAPELAGIPARLTVTVGLGPGVFELPGLAAQRPDWLAPLPPFRVDRLQDRWNGGDLLLQLTADDPVTVSHAQRVLVGDAAPFAQVAWTQAGFQRAAGMTPAGATGRNLMGFLDGTVNPAPGSPDFDEVVWSGSPDWLVGGTGMVLRRIRIDLGTWASVDRHTREQMMGRRPDTGAPLTGSVETDTPDFTARDERGLLTIPEFAHIRLAHGPAGRERILRRPYNYDDGTLGGRPDAGLLFAAYAADVRAQFVPIQRRLDDGDLLNTWTTPVGSAVFAIPPGFQEGGHVGETLLG